MTMMIRESIGMIPILIMLFFQCLLLHPIFFQNRSNKFKPPSTSSSNSKSSKEFIITRDDRRNLTIIPSIHNTNRTVFEILIRFNRTIRASIAPIVSSNLLSFPFESLRTENDGKFEGSDPISSVLLKLGVGEYQKRSMIGAICVYFSIKSLEWGFIEGPVVKFGSNEFSNQSGNEIGSSISSSSSRSSRSSSTKEDLSSSQTRSNWSFVEIIGWTFSHLTSARGFGFDWGPERWSQRKRGRSSILSLLVRMYKIKVIALIAIEFAIANRETSDGRPIQVLVESFGLPPTFPGLNLIAESILTLSFGVIIATSMDSAYSMFVLYVHFIHRIVLKLGSRPGVVDYFEPSNWPMIFDSPHLADSLSEFWSKRWHLIFRRAFMISGGKPMVILYQRLLSGNSRSVKRCLMLFGTFIASALAHEYIVSVVAQPSHSNPNKPSLRSGSMIFFLSQSIGILIEQKIFTDDRTRDDDDDDGGGKVRDKKDYMRDRARLKISSSRLIKKVWFYCFMVLTAYPFRRQYLEFNRLEGSLIRFKDLKPAYLYSPFL